MIEQRGPIAQQPQIVGRHVAGQQAAQSSAGRGAQALLGIARQNIHLGVQVTTGGLDDTDRAEGDERQDRQRHDERRTCSLEVESCRHGQRGILLH
ncbi:MAG TPA: hypothetical protein VGE94_10065 [Chloroflexota bacterium]